MGSSLRKESAFMLAKAATVRPVMAPSAPPVTMQSAVPSRMRRKLSPRAWAPDEQALTVA